MDNNHSTAHCGSDLDHGRHRIETPNSSAIASAEYDETLETLQIEFTSGALYRYFDIPPQLYRGIIESDSRGAYVNREIVQKRKKAGEYLCVRRAPHRNTAAARVKQTEAENALGHFRLRPPDDGWRGAAAGVRRA